MVNSSETNPSLFRITETTGTRQGLETGHEATHPLDDPTFLPLWNELGVSETEIRGALRPGLSDSPDELERWEAEQIQDRKAQRSSSESDRQYLIRTLYEESFSVNQLPSAPFMGSYGLTPGGLISHSRLGGSVCEPGDSTSQIVREWSEFSAPTLSEALRLIAANHGSEAADAIRSLTKWTDGWLGDLQQSGIHSYRLLSMLHAAPAMTEIADEELWHRFVESTDYPHRSRADLMAAAWAKGRLLLDSSGRYRPDDDAPEVRSALTQLATLRVHPDMQIFYTYLSPSGYINSSRKPQ